MVFRAKQRKAWKARVRHPDGRSKVCGCDTHLKATALNMERWAGQLYSDRTPKALAILDAIVTGRISLPRAYDERDDTSALLLGLNDVDIEPHIVKWQRELARRDRPNPETRAKYLWQVRQMIPAGQPFPRSRFTKHYVRDWLEARGGQTNRYRSALSSFAQFLAFEDVLPGNPVRLVRMQRENDPRTIHLTQLDAKRLIASFTTPRLRAFHAAMLATGMEFGAATRIDPATVTDASVFADGTKTASRKRTCTIYPRWQWAWDIARAEIERCPDGQRPFATVNCWTNRDALATAVKRAKINPDYRTHDHRHTWAVQAIRDGLALHVVAAQLGHKDATMVVKVYGRFLPGSGDFQGRTVTPPVTQPEKKVEV